MDNVKYNKISNRNKYLKSTLFSVLIGEFVTIAALLMFAIVISKFDVPHTFINALVIFAAAFGSLFAGYMNGRFIKQKGILTGGVCGVVLCVILIIIKLFVFTPIPTGITFIKLLLVLIASVLGGIMGVNKKSKRIKY